MLTGAHTLAALDASHRLSSIPLSDDANAAQILVELLVKRLGASLNALQASHAGFVFLNSELLHGKELSFFLIFTENIIHIQSRKINTKIGIFRANKLATTNAFELPA